MGQNGQWDSLINLITVCSVRILFWLSDRGQQNSAKIRRGHPSEGSLVENGTEGILDLDEGFG